MDIRKASTSQVAWLRREIPHWQEAGVIDADQAASILGAYRAEGRLGVRLSLGRIMLGLGGLFVGVGLIWLVAANIQDLSPTMRFTAVVALWLAFLIGAEALAARGRSRPVVGAVRLLATLGFGAVIFQAAQSLQVPAFEPHLLGLWAAGALLYAYLTASTLPFLVGVATGTFWWIAQPLYLDGSGMTVVFVIGGGAVLAAALAALHDSWRPSYAWVWRLGAAGLALVTLFAAAIPDIGSDDVKWSGWLVAELVAAALAVGAAVAVRRDNRALEPLGAVAALGVALGIAAWTTGTDTSSIGAADWGHAVVSVLAYVLLAVAIAALGTVRNHDALTWLAMAGLVVFTTFQSFAVFAPIITGAWLFVVLGAIFLGTGFLFDRARRELAEALDTDSQPTDAQPEAEGAGR